MMSKRFFVTMVMVMTLVCALSSVGYAGEILEAKIG